MATRRKAQSTPSLQKPKKAQAQKADLPRFRGLYAAIFAVLALLIGSYVLFSKASSATYTWNPSSGAQSGRLFSSDSPVNQVIPGDIRYKADAAPRLATLRDGLVSLLMWAVPVFDANSATPKVRIWCYLTDPNIPSDTCNGINTMSIPVPAGVYGQVGGDGHIEIVDNSSREIFDFWIWKNCFLIWNPVNASYCPASGNHASIDGIGVNGSTNVAKLAGGIVRTYEVEQGYIDHALRFSVPNTCGNVHYYPAMSFDGKDMTGSCIPIGSRIQLDPSINVDAIAGITPFEKMVGHALQKYGAYCDDTGGTFGFTVELDRTGRQVYTRAGAPAGADGFHFSHLPWEKVNMIDPQWNLDGSKAYNWGNASNPAPTVPPVVIAPAPTGPGTNGTSAAANNTPTSRTVTPSTQKGTQPSGGAASGVGSSQAGGQTTPSISPNTSRSDAVDLKSGKVAGVERTVTSSVIGSFLFVNHSTISWKPVDGAVKYQVRVNNGASKTVAETSFSIWHLGNGEQKIIVQGLSQDGSFVGDEQTLSIKPSCTWYGVCK